MSAAPATPLLRWRPGGGPGQRYHVVGDERLETGDPEFVPRSAGRDRIAYVLARAEESDGTLAAYPVFSR